MSPLDPSARESATPLRLGEGGLLPHTTQKETRHERQYL